MFNAAFASGAPCRAPSCTGGGGFHDPHFFSLSGTPFTYSGVGEHLLVALAPPSVVSSTSIVSWGQSLGTTTASAGNSSSSSVAAAPAWQLWASFASVTPPPAATSLLFGPNSTLSCPSGASAMRAVVAVAAGGSVVEVTLSATNSLITLVGGVAVDMSTPRSPQWGSSSSDSSGSSSAPPPPVTVNVDATTSITSYNGSITIVWSSVGAAIVVSQISTDDVWDGSMLSVQISLSAAWANATVGLLGDNSGRSGGDLRNVLGTYMGTSVTEAQLYGAYGVGWRVDPSSNASSLFVSGTTGASVATTPSFASDVLLSASTADLSALSALCGMPADASDPVFASCAYDAVCSGSAAVGAATAAASISGALAQAAMGPFPFFTSPAADTVSVSAGADSLQIAFGASLSSGGGGPIVYALLMGPPGTTINGSSGVVYINGTALSSSSASSQQLLLVRVSATIAVVSYLSPSFALPAAVAVKEVSVTVVPPPAPAGLSGGAIAGITILVAAVVGALVMLAVVYARRTRRHPSDLVSKQQQQQQQQQQRYPTVNSLLKLKHTEMVVSESGGDTSFRRDPSMASPHTRDTSFAALNPAFRNESVSRGHRKVSSSGGIAAVLRPHTQQQQPSPAMVKHVSTLSSSVRVGHQTHVRESVQLANPLATAYAPAAVGAAAVLSGGGGGGPPMADGSGGGGFASSPSKRVIRGVSHRMVDSGLGPQVARGRSPR